MMNYVFALVQVDRVVLYVCVNAGVYVQEIAEITEDVFEAVTVDHHHVHKEEDAVDAKDTHVIQ